MVYFQNKFIVFTLFLFLGSALYAPGVARAQSASLFLTPPTAVYPIGEPFVVDVRIDTGGEEVGTADVTVSYEADDLMFSAFSSEGSVFSRILVDDTRTPGKIDISAFVERNRPAYVGTDGLVARLTFIPKRNVATQVRFSKAAATPPLSLTASVGDLANVLTSLGAATYTLVPKEVLPAQVAATSGGGAGDNTLAYDPEPIDGWHATNTVKVSWDLPSGTSALRTGVSTSSDEKPTKVYPVPVNSTTLEGLADGVQYFHVQFETNAGWGEVREGVLRIDTTPPTLVLGEGVAETGVRGLSIEAVDDGSGIAEYMVGIGGDDGEVWEPTEDGVYVPESLRAGEYVYTVTVTDAVGNTATEDYLFVVKSIESPLLTEVPERVLTGDEIVVRGTTYENAEVTVFVSHNDGDAQEQKVQSDGAGNFSAVLTDGASEGKYTVWFQVTDKDGATSPLSIKRSVNASQPYIMLFGSIAVTYLSIIVPLIALILLLVLVLWLGWTYIKSYRKRVRREANEAFSVVREEFEDLREELVTQIGMLEKANQSRKLTREEMRIFTDLSKRLDYIESHIAQEIDDIEEVQVEEETVRKVKHNTAALYKPGTPSKGGKVTFTKQGAQPQKSTDPAQPARAPGHTIKIARAK